MIMYIFNGIRLTLCAGKFLVYQIQKQACNDILADSFPFSRIHQDLFYRNLTHSLPPYIKRMLNLVTNSCLNNLSR